MVLERQLADVGRAVEVRVGHHPLRKQFPLRAAGSSAPEDGQRPRRPVAVRPRRVPRTGCGTRPRTFPIHRLPETGPARSRPSIAFGEPDRCEPRSKIRQLPVARFGSAPRQNAARPAHRHRAGALERTPLPVGRRSRRWERIPLGLRASPPICLASRQDGQSEAVAGEARVRSPANPSRRTNAHIGVLSEAVR